MEKTLIRVGNDEYAHHNNSYGMTTLQDRHAAINGASIKFEFLGKSGIKHRIDLQDRRLARIVRKCQELPGEELFQYLDESGQICDINSDDVNNYLTSITGENFTAKDFRTWAGTVLAARALQAVEAAHSNAKRRKNIIRAIEAVAKRLGNTTAVCRKCYVHPVILESYMDGTLLKFMEDKARSELKGPHANLSSGGASCPPLLLQNLKAKSHAAGNGKADPSA